ncbi:MAG: internal scaffolding protein [Microviridae sp.]|nr:MAG: internal scaffolding protein [Microviridae sp.]
MKVKLKASYDDFDADSDKTGLECKDDSLAQQHQKDETDINNIVKMFLRTGEIPQRTMPPMQGDFTTAPDMQTAMNLIVEARMAFMQQPAEIRARFHNDPAEFVAFCSDETNLPDMKKYGLLSEAKLQEMEKQEAAAKQADFDKRYEERLKKEGKPSKS